MDTATDSVPSLPKSDRPTVIETFNLQKTYRSGFWLTQKIPSLKGCNLEVYLGETFGLLGPNGAGKTTLLKLLLGIIRPTKGQGLLFGEPLGDQETKKRIGYLPENPYFYDYLTGWDILKFTAGLFQIPQSVQRQRIPELLDLVGLSKTAARRKQLRQYSKGMLQRVGMAQALINDPELVFLDEPMSGLDPIGRYQFREIILSLKAQGKTVFFNSHILSDVELICDRVAILSKGELLCMGSLQELLGTTETYYVKGRGGSLDVLKKRLVSLSFQDGYWFGYLLSDPYDFLTTLNLMGVQILALNLARPTLEDFFVEKLRDHDKQAQSQALS